MSCPKCGAVTSPEAKFCPSCGAGVGSPSETGLGTPQSRPGKFHRFLLVILIAWTALFAGLVIATSVTVGSAEANRGAVLGWTLGVGFLGLIWAFGAVVLSLLAIATKPSPTVRWPAPTKWVATGLALLVFSWPVYSTRQLVNTTSATGEHLDSPSRFLMESLWEHLPWVRYRACRIISSNATRHSDRQGVRVGGTVS